MTLFHATRKRPAATGDAAALVMEAVPLVMRVIRQHMRSQRPSGLTVSQFRVMIFLSRHEGASLSAAAEHLAVTLPSMSKMVDGLVRRGLVSRETAVDDRRRILLALTLEGRQVLHSARQVARASLAEALSALPDEEREIVARAMRSLTKVFSPRSERS